LATFFIAIMQAFIMKLIMLNYQVLIILFI